jgi:hypothetical protein
MTGATADAPMVTVTDGRIILGFVFARGRTGFEGFTADQVSLGLFKTRVAAANAIADHAVDVTDSEPVATAPSSRLDHESTGATETAKTWTPQLEECTPRRRKGRQIGQEPGGADREA